MAKIPLKTAAEIEKMRLAGQSAATVLEALSHLVEPGITTGEIDRKAADLIDREGCRSAFLGYRKFPGNICISVNEEVVHGIGGLRRLNYGDIVKIDVGVNRGGWIGDTAVTVPCGLIDSETERLCAATRAMLYSSLAFATAGRHLGDLSAHIQKEAYQHGFGVVKEFTGHGVGSKLHEEPEVPNFGRPGTGPKLKPGMTIAVEPMINLGVSEVKILADRWTIVTADGQPSAHFEHTILITPDGPPEILTRLP